MGGSGSKSSSKKPVPSRPAVSISSIDRAVLDLKNARDRLHRYRKKLEKDDEALLQRAKQAKQDGKKEKALGIMRLRKYKQQMMVSCENQLLNVLQMVDTIDSKQNEAQVLSALEEGKNTLKKLHEERTVEDVLELMDAVAEENQIESEINQILHGVPELDPADELAVEKELAAMEAELFGDKTPVELPVAPGDKPISLPEVPTGTPTKTVIEGATKEPERVAVAG